MKSNTLLNVKDMGQSIWLDYVHREKIASGETERTVREDGVSGFTSNPSIFDKAISGSDAYDDDIRALAKEGRKPVSIFESLAIEDIQSTADILRQEFDRTDGRDGYVSFEVDPHLAYDAGKTIAEAHRLWNAIDRPNVLIKIPGTREGLTAIRQCLADGLNINITLLFGLPRYREVAEAYLGALEDRVRNDKPVDPLASVASFFLSRIDVLVDSLLEEKMAGNNADAQLAKQLRGKVAIASARQAYQIYKEIFGGERFAQLAKHGARPQRLLWASTSTKNPDFSDVKYVEALIGPDTVNTMPPDTLEAYRDHGQPEARLETCLDESQQAIDSLQDLGIDIDEVTQQLEEEGVEKFVKPYDDLMASLEKKSRESLSTA